MPRGKVRRELLALGHRPRKRLAQHLLADPGIVRRIVQLAALNGTEDVLEIGAGLGVLSAELASRASRLWLIEIDRDFAARLREQFTHAPHVTVVEENVLTADLQAFGTPPITLVGNLPYNISTPVLFRLLDHCGRFARLVLMLQREVAQRLRAEPGRRQYGALSVLVQYRACVRRGLLVDARAFVPPPRVQSEVVVLEPHREAAIQVRDPDDFRRVVRATFQKRRKQLVNSLGAVAREPRQVLLSAGVDAARRPETLTIAEFGRIADAVTAERSDASEESGR
jgi:16S rRNA (adenine1518-N6/adenine1519-N6)-dimethyltransferase